MIEITVRRTWRERLFSWPWRPWAATRLKTFDEYRNEFRSEVAQRLSEKIRLEVAPRVPKPAPWPPAPEIERGPWRSDRPLSVDTAQYSTPGWRPNRPLTPAPVPPGVERDDYGFPPITWPSTDNAALDPLAPRDWNVVDPLGLRENSLFDRREPEPPQENIRVRQDADWSCRADDYSSSSDAADGSTDSAGPDE